MISVVWLMPSRAARGLLGLTLVVAMSAGCSRTRNSDVGPARVASAGGLPGGRRAPDGPPRSPLGDNLTGVSDYTAEWPFVDVFRSSRPWTSGSASKWSDDAPLDLDENGDIRSLGPDQIAHTFMLWGGVQFPRGDYLVLYQGEGEMVFPTAEVVRSIPGRIVIRPNDPTQGIAIDVLHVDPHHPLRDIHVIMPGGRCADDPLRECHAAADCHGACLPFESTFRDRPFHPLFLRSIEAYSALRFMDWMGTNDSTQAVWANRPKPTDARWTAQGIPLEVMVALANITGKDPWFSLPHRADDAYVEQFATYVRDHLRPELHAFVEYSNEVWNGTFQQSAYAREHGLAANLSDSPFEAQLQFQSRRSIQIFAIWERVFGGRSRFVRVMASQSPNVWASRTLLEFEDAFRQTDALAIAPYFGGYLGAPEEEGRVGAMTVDALFDELGRRAVPDVLADVKKQAEVAHKYGLALIAYEGGQHLVGTGSVVDDDRVNQLFDAANRDGRMGAIYLDYLRGWRRAGGTLFMHFVNCSLPSKWGRWGALEGLLQPAASAPKSTALRQFMTENPSWW
jgi:hypothetical protein